MSLYKRNGIYHYDFTVRGVRKRGSTGLKDKYLAGLFQNDLMTKACARGVESLRRKPILLNEFSVEFLQWVEDSHSIENQTRRYYRNGWRLLKGTVLAETRMNEITNHLCETITFPGGPATANTALRTLRRMCAKALELRKISKDELPEINMRKEEPRSVAMTVENAEQIAERMPDGDAKDAFLILRSTGMRPNECFGMLWEYVNLSAALYLNPRGKTKAARRAIPLLSDAAIVLKRRFLIQGSPVHGWVFPASSGSGHMVTIHKSFTKARDAAGLPKTIVLYTARHGVGTDLGKILSLREVMQILGHSDTKTAMIYQNPTTADITARLEAARPAGRVQ